MADQYPLNRTRRDGLGHYCKQCNAANRRSHYFRNRPAVKEQARIATLRRMDSRRRTMDAVKTTAGCIDCGYDANPLALEFDHREPNLKSFTIGSGNRAWDAVWVEVEKCDVRCANCHRIRTLEASAVARQNRKAVTNGV